MNYNLANSSCVPSYDLCVGILRGKLGRTNVIWSLLFTLNCPGILWISALCCCTLDLYHSLWSKAVDMNFSCWWSYWVSSALFVHRCVPFCSMYSMCCLWPPPSCVRSSWSVAFSHVLPCLHLGAGGTRKQGWGPAGRCLKGKPAAIEGSGSHPQLPSEKCHRDADRLQLSGMRLCWATRISSYCVGLP